MKKQQGIALVMMLFIAAILALITINFIHESNHQLKIAQRLQDKAQAISQLENAKAEIVYELLTKDTLSLEQQGWNFYLEPFELEGVEVRIQDLRGLFGLYGFVPRSEFAKLLGICKVQRVNNAAVAQKVLAEHNDESLPVDKLQRLYALLGKQSDTVRRCLKNNITRHNVGNFNPSVAPKETLLAKLGNNQATEFLAVRGQGRGSLNDVFNKFNSAESFNGFSTLAGPYFRVILRSKVSQSSWGEDIEFKIKLATPLDPIMFLSYQSGINE